MKTRVITGIVLVLVSIPVVIFSETIALPIVMSALAAVGGYEMSKCIGINKTSRVLSTILCAALPLVFVFVRGGTLSYTIVSVVYVAVAVAIVGGLITIRNKCELKGLVAFFAVAYVTLTFSLMTASAVLLPDKAFVMIFLCSWTSDTMAYFIGSKFGKTKLAPILSPKKTVEGAIGGAVFGGVAMVVYSVLLSHDLKLIIGMFFAGVVIAVFSQFGDLFASAYKRKYNVKDYGTLFPGHGGVMDRFDSVLGATVVFPLTMFLVALFYLHF